MLHWQLETILDWWTGLSCSNIHFWDGVVNYFSMSIKCVLELVSEYFLFIMIPSGQHTVPNTAIWLSIYICYYLLDSSACVSFVHVSHIWNMTLNQNKKCSHEHHIKNTTEKNEIKHLQTNATNPTKSRGWSRVLRKGEKFLFLARHPPYCTLVKSDGKGRLI